MHKGQSFAWILAKYPLLQPRCMDSDERAECRRVRPMRVIDIHPHRCHRPQHRALGLGSS